MKAVIKKSDFVLNPYMESNDLRATIQILNTLIPYLGLWAIAVKVATISLWLLPPILVLMTLFLVRSFSLMHDCGHYSLFRSKAVNRLVGFGLGVFNAIPQYAWSRDHAYHHKTNGDWERYRGVATFLSTDEFAALSPRNQQFYERLRHPLMIFPGGFFYLAIKPRLILLIGIYEFITDLIVQFRTRPGIGLSKMIASHHSKQWASATEFWDVLLNNICVVGSWIFFCSLLGPGLFLSIYSIVLTFAAAIFISVFFVQHNFEGSYAHKTEGWNYLQGAVEGSSYLELPAILKWFTADISYHNIHHLSERIPNYNLKACHRQNSHLLTNVKTLRLSDMPACSRFILWDAAADTLVSIRSFRQAVQVRTKELV